MLIKFKYTIHLLIIIFSLYHIKIIPAEIILKNYPILSQKRLELTREYTEKHYFDLHIFHHILPGNS